MRPNVLHRKSINSRHHGVALLFHDGFESGNTTGWSSVSASPPTVQTGTVNSGTYAAKTAAASTSCAVRNQSIALGTALYNRGYFYFTSVAPTNRVDLIDVLNTGFTAAGGVSLETSGKIGLRSISGSVLIGSSATVLVNTWNLVEVEVLVPASGSGTVTAKLNGTQFATSTTASVGNTAIGSIRVGNAFSSSTPATIYFDDFACSAVGWIGA